MAYIFSTNDSLKNRQSPRVRFWEDWTKQGKTQNIRAKFTHIYLSVKIHLFWFRKIRCFIDARISNKTC